MSNLKIFTNDIEQEAMTANYKFYTLDDIVEHNFDVIHKKINELIVEINKLKGK